MSLDTRAAVMQDMRQAERTELIRAHAEIAHLRAQLTVRSAVQARATRLISDLRDETIVLGLLLLTMATAGLASSLVVLVVGL